MSATTNSEMKHQATDVETSDSRWHWLYGVGGVADQFLFVLFLIGLVGVIAVRLQPTTTNGWFTSFQNNWLVQIGYRLFQLTRRESQAVPQKR